MVTMAEQASGDELRQIVDGKLAKLGREPQNVQVLILELEKGLEQLSFKDDSEVFLEIEPDIPAVRESDTYFSEGSESDIVDGEDDCYCHREAGSSTFSCNKGKKFAAPSGQRGRKESLAGRDPKGECQSEEHLAH